MVRPRTALTKARKNIRCPKCGGAVNRQRVRCKKCAGKMPKN